MRGKGKFHFKQESQARRQENAIHHPVMYSIGTSQNHTGEIFEINTKKIMSSRQAAVLHLITVCWQFISVFHFVACPKQFTKFCQYAQQYDLIALVQKSFHWCKMIKDSSVWICWILVAEVPLSLWAAKQKAFLFSSFHTIFFFFYPLVWMLTTFPKCNRLPLSIWAGFAPLLWWKSIQSPHKISPKLLCRLIKASWTNMQSAI